MKELVSVVTPIYNAERWLEIAIESALAQTWKRVELILVDDGSTDASLEIARRYESASVRVLSLPNTGGCAARNAALEIAQGDFIQFLDADDVLHPQKLEHQIRRLAESPEHTVATCAWGRLFGDDLNAVRFEPEPIWADLSPVDWVVTTHIGGGMMATGAWLVPRSVADRAGLWATRRMRNEDGEYFTRVVLNSSGVIFVPDAKVYYRSGIDGWSTAQTEAAVAGHLWSLESITHELLSREDSPRTRRAVATSFDRFVFDFYPRYRQYVRSAEQWVQRLGGSAFVRPDRGLYAATASVVGWRFARRLQHYLRALRKTFKRTKSVETVSSAVSGGALEQHSRVAPLPSPTVSRSDC